MTVRWSLTKFCEAEDQSTVQFRFGNDYKPHSSRHHELPEDISKFWAAALCQTLLQFEQSTCFPSCGLLAKDALSKAFWEGGELVGWVTPGKPQSNAPSRPSWWVWVCTWASPYTTKGHRPKGASSPHLGCQRTVSWPQASPDQHQKSTGESGGVLLGTTFLQVPMLQVIIATPFSV